MRVLAALRLYSKAFIIPLGWLAYSAIKVFRPLSSELF